MFFVNKAPSLFLLSFFISGCANTTIFENMKLPLLNNFLIFFFSLWVSHICSLLITKTLENGLKSRKNYLLNLQPGIFTKLPVNAMEHYMLRIVFRNDRMHVITFLLLFGVIFVLVKCLSFWEKKQWKSTEGMTGSCVFFFFVDKNTS